MNQWARAAKAVKLLAPVSCANTAAATTGWVDITDAEGDIMFLVETGVITAGGIVYTVEHATAGDGTGSAAFTPDDGAFGTVSAGTVQKRVISATAINAFVRVVGTITTGPVVVGATCVYQSDEPA